MFSLKRAKPTTEEIVCLEGEADRSNQGRLSETCSGDLRPSVSTVRSRALLWIEAENRAIDEMLRESLRRPL